MQAGLGGILTMSQTVIPSTKATDSVVQSWLGLIGVADNGENVYAIANDTQGPYVKSADLKSAVGCGKPFTMT